MSAFDWGRFQLDAFQIDPVTLAPCDSDYVESGYMEAGYHCGVDSPVVTQSSPGKPKTRKRVFIEQDGEVLLFDNNADAAAYLEAQKAIEKAQEGSKQAPQRVKKPKKAKEPERIDIEALKAFYAQEQEVIKFNAFVQQMLAEREFGVLLDMQAKLKAYMDEEDDIEALLLLA